MPVKSEIIPIGYRIARLTVIGIAPSDKSRSRRSECRCDCGKIVFVRNASIRQQKAKSCGCHNIEQLVSQNFKYGRFVGGAKPSKTYASWNAMKNRCLNKNSEKYKDYGGRGISVCERWLEFENFIKDMGEKPAQTSLGRINNDGNYEPENCRWETIFQQARNTRYNKNYTINGIHGCVSELAVIFKLPIPTAYSRLRRGLTPEQAFTNPVKYKNKSIQA